jgi:hypothetical protein
MDDAERTRVQLTSRQKNLRELASVLEEYARQMDRPVEEWGKPDPVLDELWRRVEALFDEVGKSEGW